MAENNKYDVLLDINNFDEALKTYIKEKKNFIIFLYGQKDANGHSWCPDCVLSEPFVSKAKERVMQLQSKKEVYFVEIPVDYEKKAVFKENKIVKMTKIPCLVYYFKGHEMGRLIEGEMSTQESIDEFIDQIYEDVEE